MFRTTQWTQILNARTIDESRRREMLGQLLVQYWKPVYCYLRRKGHRNEQAKDLTQGFFTQVVLDRELVQQADRAKGRFRTFLLTALDRYVIDVHRAETAKKRRPPKPIIGLDGLESPDMLCLSDEASPSEAFDYAWASALIDEVLADAQRECKGRGMAVHWEVFAAKVLRPILENTESPAYEELCAMHGISEERKARNMVITVRRRLKAVLEHHVRQLVGADDEVADEIDDLIEILSKSSAAS